ncbi:MAG: translation initiation factor IF-2 N-terminal domain-containing protein, partial [Solirubrobacteraceae bacterium]
MAKKRVHEIAKEQGLSSKDLLAKLKAAGVNATVASSSVDEAIALKAISSNGAGGPAKPAAPRAGSQPAPAAPRA